MVLAGRRCSDVVVEVTGGRWQRVHGACLRALQLRGATQFWVLPRCEWAAPIASHFVPFTPFYHPPFQCISGGRHERPLFPPKDVCPCPRLMLASGLVRPPRRFHTLARLHHKIPHHARCLLKSKSKFQGPLPDVRRTIQRADRSAPLLQTSRCATADDPPPQHHTVIMSARIPSHCSRHVLSSAQLSAMTMT